MLDGEASEDLEHLISDAASAWRLRAAAISSASTRLFNLTKSDEKLSAILDVLRIAGDWKTPEINRHEIDQGTIFVVVWRGIVSETGRLFSDWLGTFGDATQKSDKSEMGRSCIPAALVSAFAWVGLTGAGQAIPHMQNPSSPFARATAVAALGARRADPGPLLPPALSDGSPLVRARAYRTTGQLGRRDLLPQLRPGLTDPDPECRFWSAWAAARMGASEPLNPLADIAWNNLPRADRALDLLLRRLDVPQAKDWLRELAKLPGRERSVIRATGVIGDPFYIPWLIERMAEPATARLAGEAFSMITGLDLAYRDLDRKPPTDFQSGPNDDPEDENVALDDDENLPWPDPARIGQWWAANRARFIPGTAHFLGAPKDKADWLEALSDAFQRQRHAAALELAIRQPNKAMFEVRARGRLQRQLLAKARGMA